jgi:hypothetical protein
MKFPKSIHAEGWSSHLDTPATPKTPLKQGVKAGAKPVSLHTPLQGDEPVARARAATAAPIAAAAPSAYSHDAAAPAVRPAGPATVKRPERADATPWIIGAGVGALLIGGALVAYRNMAPSEPAETAVVSQATPSAEDALLQSAPPSAGPVEPAAPEATAAMPEPTPAPVEAPAVKTPEPVAEAPRAVAAAPVEPKVQAPAVVRAAPAPVAPVVKTLPPPVETLAQASPPAETLREPVQAPVAPVVTPTPATPPAAVPPLATAPVAPTVIPPVAQAEQPQPPVVEDAGITAKVRLALSADSTLAAVPIAVTTDQGVVKLEGQAPDAPTRERATVVAASAAGVKAVDNRLTLPPATVVGQLSTPQ